MYIQLLVRDHDPLTVKFIFDLFIKAPAHSPVILCWNPYPKAKDHSAFSQFIYVHQHILIFPGSLILFQDLFQDLLCLVHV